QGGVVVVVQVVHPDDGVPAAQQPFAQVVADEAGGAGDHDAGHQRLQYSTAAGSPAPRRTPLTSAIAPPSRSSCGSSSQTRSRNPSCATASTIPSHRPSSSQGVSSSPYSRRASSGSTNGSCTSGAIP